MKKALAILLCGLMVFGIFAGCNNNSTTTAPSKDNPSNPSGNGTTAPQKQSDRTDIKINAGTAINTLNPYETNLSGEDYLLAQIYEGLVYFNEGEISPLLCEKWEINDTSTEFTFTLKKGVKFHNGEELKADDVVFSVERAKNAPNMSSKVVGIDHAEKVSDYVVKIVMKSPSGVLLTNLCKLWIVNKNYAESQNLALGECGTGPYAIEKHVEQQYVDLKAFEDYHRGAPAIKTVNVKEIYDSETILSSFLAGELDFLGVSTTNIEYVKEQDKWDFLTRSSSSVTFFIFNCEVITDKVLRQACAYATDKQGFIDMCMEGHGEVANFFCKPGDVFGATTEGATLYDYNVDKAKDTLKKGGYTNEVKLGTLTTTGTTRSAAIQAQWELAGIKVDCEVGDASSIVTQMAQGNIDMSMMGDSAYTDFNDCSYLFTSENLNTILLSRYCNDDIDRLFAKGASTADTEKRKAIYKELNALIQDEQPYIPLYYGESNYAYDRALNFHFRSGASYVYIVDLSWK